MAETIAGEKETRGQGGRGKERGRSKEEKRGHAKKKACRRQKRQSLEVRQKSEVRKRQGVQEREVEGEHGVGEGRWRSDGGLYTHAHAHVCRLADACGFFKTGYGIHVCRGSSRALTGKCGHWTQLLPLPFHSSPAPSGFSSGRALRRLAWSVFVGPRRSYLRLAALNAAWP